LQRTINALNDKIEQASKSIKDQEQKIKDADERARSANKKASEESLTKEVLTELSAYKIVGSQADFAVTAIIAKGFAKVEENSEGLYERSICTIKDGKPLKASLKEMCKWFAESNQFLVSSSGKPGTGMQHQSNNPERNAGANRNYYGMVANKK
jgi:hypothetical protein